MIYVIPDTQLKPGVQNPLIPVAHHIAKVKPSKVIHLGDHWDFPSLSLYDKGKRSHRVKNYIDDLKAGNESMREFWGILKKEWPQHKKKCQFIILEGNHENRRNRAIEYGPDELSGLIEAFPLNYEHWNKKIPFLHVYKTNGIEFSHYFQNTGSSRPIGTAAQLLTKRHVSSIAGHKQGFEYSEMLCGSDKKIQSIIAGSCYFHKEGYMAHNNHHFRGVIILKNLKNGTFDFERISLRALK